ncbi:MULTISPECIES: FAD binding domain-containing protein [Rhodococcus]|nr:MULTISPECIES: FAD binding domain-containing protein [Rhodococcus]OCC21734.1 FAD-binding molybdopterin dehydrogenase [Prescottella equi]ANQ75132.1 FAD-binding molybdopterin dehydrogenase [Rhodococcus sp. 008]AZI65086.1 FAD-binding molybdopterin dehydrogenase [Rhodococcus sp. NJ-530]KDQ03414.1 FAD-binding molybdopterin dehydrogenase [Rhodococcus qingshengii]KSU80820.1 FAD-binding molybdopterin dehydrogenase [Rhodococcus qingshengii]
MDLHSVDEVLVPRTRAELPCASPGIGFIGGGTWLYSEPQPHLTTLVDLAGFDWEAVAVGDLGLEIAATCTIEELCRAELPASWRAAALFQHCADALLASWKVLRYATVGGNIALSFPAGAMTTLCTALDAELTIWRPDGTEYSFPVVDFVIDDSRNVLRSGEIIRSIRIPVHALTARTAMRKLAQTSLGRSAVAVAGRCGADGFTLAITAATRRPYALKFDELPDATALADALRSRIPEDAYFTDVHGTAPWRKAMTELLAEEIRGELE